MLHFKSYGANAVIRVNTSKILLSFLFFFFAMHGINFYENVLNWTIEVLYCLVKIGSMVKRRCYLKQIIGGRQMMEMTKLIQQFQKLP